MANEKKLQVVEVKKVQADVQSRRFGERRVRLFFWPEKFNPVGDLLSGERFRRPNVAFREALKEVLEQAGFDPNTAASWSQKAGCASCPCSPGFVLDARGGFDLHVTYRLKA